MSDDEILLLADHTTNKLCVRSVTDDDLLAFARAIESRTLTNQKARWYQEGVEAEREACAKIVDAEMDEWDDYDVNVALNNAAAEIRSRGR